ncbi:TonB-dependent siderophore receptor [Arcobacter sp. CECT 8985]|uniref:TonB-dependent receptor plug domain-containing protein n=1 Tax=Arcobacter sp. CECT 8985 TaxID=1935424 RepID=UPI00100C34A0|nr:TonB-dependent receptor plug domain-containing protein [Arcobacter sp. CECT 8985]RXJ83505.1 TonB-dependent receptor [Arcobacter sp. CECT 8985]
MKFYLFVCFFFFTMLNAQSLDNLLKQYKEDSEKSLETVDEKLGHVFIYSQKDIRLMQYKRLGDILKELPIMNYNKNRLGFPSLSLAGSKTSVSGFFRFFINDHEISSTYTQSPFLTWGNLPLDFIDHIEVYYGDSSLALGNDTGIYFIRIYTKKAYKENATQLNLELQKAGTNAKSLLHSKTLENGWSYLAYFRAYNRHNTEQFNNQDIKDDSSRQYAYLQLNKDKTNIDIGYTKANNDIFMGKSSDNVPTSGEVNTKEYYIDFTRKFLYDNSVKFTFAYDVNNRENEEKNDNFISILPAVDLSVLSGLMPIDSFNFKEDLKFTKLNTSLSKEFKTATNNLILGTSFVKKDYDVKNRKVSYGSTLMHMHKDKSFGSFYGFTQEKMYSLFMEDEYKVLDNLSLILNGKINRYERDDVIEDSTDKVYRVGFIYTPFKNFGIKSFYTRTLLPPNFYNVDYANKNDVDLKTQKYNIYTIETVFTTENSKSRLIFDDVRIKNFLYLTPVGFTNQDKIHSKGLIFKYDYQFDNSKLEFNYYTTWLNVDENNSGKGGFLKYFGEYDKFSYFSSIIYRNEYSYKDIHVPSSFDLNMGVTYNYSKDLSLSLQGSNLLNKSTQSLYSTGGLRTGSEFAYKDRQKNFMLSMKWVF